MPLRDEKGRFAKGHSGNPNGRPPKKRELRYYEITVSACTYADWKRVVQKAVQQAIRGDAVARKWLADYLVGMPEQNVNVNGAIPLITEVIFRGPSGDDTDAVDD